MLLALTILIAQQLGPTLPPWTSEQIHAINQKVQAALSEGRFEEAEKALAEWPQGRIGYKFAPGAPPEAIALGEVAEKFWKEASNGELLFERSEDALVQLEFIEKAPEGDPDPVWENGKVRARIPLTFGTQGQRSSERSLLHGVLRAFGFAAGLAPSHYRGNVMGIDDRLPFVTEPELQPKEREALTRILAARKQLALAVSQRVRIVPAVPKLVIEPLELDAGNVTTGMFSKYSVTIRNSGNAPVEFVPELTCRCLYLDAIRELAPGQSKTIEAGIDTNGIIGPVHKSILFHTNDPAGLHQELKLHVNSVPEYRVLPADVMRVTLNEVGPTSAHFILYATPGNPIQVKEAFASRPGVEVSIEPWIGEILDPLYDTQPVRRLGYKVIATFPANFPAGIDWVSLAIRTDSRSQPIYQATMQVQKGIVAQPKSFYFGGVDHDKESTRSVELSHGSQKFSILSATVEGGPFTVAFQNLDNEGKKYKITVTYKGGEPGALKGAVILKTDHKGGEEIVIPIGGTAK